MKRREFLKGMGAVVPAVFAAKVLEADEVGFLSPPDADALGDFRQPLDMTAVVADVQEYDPILQAYQGQKGVLYADPLAGPYSGAFAVSTFGMTSASYRTAGPSYIRQMRRPKMLIELDTDLARAKKLLK